MVNCCFVSIVLYLWIVSYFCCLFSYHSLLELHYGDRMNKSQTTREQAIEVGLSFREAEQRLGAKLFLDKSAMKLVGYQTSHKEIRDLYHSVYLLRRSLGPPPCGPQQRRKAICDILSSLRNQLHWWVYPIAAEEDTQGPVNEPQSRPRRREDPHEEALQEGRAAHQRVLEAAKVFKSDIEWLNWEWEMHNKPALVATVGVTCGIILWTDNWGPPVGLNRRGG